MDGAKGKLGITECSKRLKPWIDLTNAFFYGGGAAETARQNPSEELRAYAAKSPAECEQLAQLVRAIFDTIINHLTDKLEDFTITREYLPQGGFIKVASLPDGTIEVDVTPLIRNFFEALTHAEAARIKRCQQCGRGLRIGGRIFYLGRASYQGRPTLLGCSKACTHALRMARWRAKGPEYHVNRKIAENERANKIEGQKRGKNHV